jgi:hypothetical protein
MTALLTADPVEFSTGIKNYDVEIGTGTAKLQISVEGRDFKDIPNTDKTANYNNNITIPVCRIQAILTGDATVAINNVRQSVIG